MKTSRVTRRVARRWTSRIRRVPTRFFATDALSFVRLAMPQRERDVLFAMLFREIGRRTRAVNRKREIPAPEPTGENEHG